MYQQSAATAERRTNKRYRALDNAFAILHSDVIIVTSLIDISENGLSFECMPEIDEIPPKGCRLDVFLNDDDLYDFYLQNVPFETTSEIEITNGSKTVLKMKRVGVKFGDLSPKQHSLLDYFLRSLTLHDG